jgi:hypothetical protein
MILLESDGSRTRQAHQKKLERTATSLTCKTTSIGGRSAMLTISKSLVLDDQQRPIAVQIPIEEFERIEDIIENYGLAALMEDVKDEERLSVEDAKRYYQSLK